MKNLKLCLIALSVLFLASCQKDEMTVNLKQSGKLVVELKDSTGTVYPGVKVRVRLSYYSESSNEIDSKKTDSKGVINFGELQSGTYYILVDTIKSGNKSYVINKPAQVISGSTKTLKLSPLDFIGTVNISLNIVNSSSTKITPTNVKVALVKRTDYSPNLNRQKVLAKAIDVKSVNANSTVTFTSVPANIYYIPYVFLNDNDTIGVWMESYLSVPKDEVYNTSYIVYASQLVVVKIPSYKMTIEYYSYTTYTEKPVPNLNVVLVRSNDYYNQNLTSASLTTILSYAVMTAKTNTNGIATFTNLPVGNYYSYGYYGESQDSWMTSVYVTENGSTASEVSVTGSDFGLTK